MFIEQAGTQKITPFLWFDRQAEDAAKLYVSIFKNSSLGKVVRYGKEGFEIHHMPEGTAMTVEFQIENQSFTALNGGPLFAFNQSVSFVVHCDTQKEVDNYWNTLAEGGDEKAQQCGWLKDKFGLSWQIVPNILPKLLSDPDPKKAGRVMQAMLQMKKIEIAKLQNAFEEN